MAKMVSMKIQITPPDENLEYEFSYFGKDGFNVDKATHLLGFSENPLKSPYARKTTNTKNQSQEQTALNVQYKAQEQEQQTPPSVVNQSGPANTPNVLFSDDDQFVDDNVTFTFEI